MHACMYIVWAPANKEGVGAEFDIKTPHAVFLGLENTRRGHHDPLPRALYQRHGLIQPLYLGACIQM